MVFGLTVLCSWTALQRWIARLKRAVKSNPRRLRLTLSPAGFEPPTHGWFSSARWLEAGGGSVRLPVRLIESAAESWNATPPCAWSL